jgi:hypothetical protein
MKKIRFFNNYPFSFIFGGVGFALLILILAFLFLPSFFSFFFSTQTPFSFSDCHALDRSVYSLPPGVFENLPPLSACFVSAAYTFESGAFRDASFFTSSYYLQPEFYPSFFTQGLPQWQNPIGTHYGVVGYGAYPSFQILSIRPGETKTVRVFFYSGFGVRGYQGAALQPVFQNPAHASFVSVFLDENATNGFLLGPNFPKFSREWVKPVDITIALSPAAPPDEIILAVETRAPPLRIQEAGAALPYYSSITQFVGERPAFYLTIVPTT